VEEAVRLGFHSIYLPAWEKLKMSKKADFQLLPLKNISELFEAK
jgi:hypothetical protein